MKRLLFCLLVLLPFSPHLMAQAAAAKPAAQNAWEEIYIRIAQAYSPTSLLELLKSMELESDQDSLASSYALILKDHVHHYNTRKNEDAGYAEVILSFLLDKVAELADTMKLQNPEVANVIAITLIPELDYSSEMGKADIAIGKLEAVEFAPGIIRRLEKINNIMLDGGQDWFGLNYSAMGSLLALQEFALPESFPALYKVMYGPFNRTVRNQAKNLLRQLLQNKKVTMQAEFTEFVANTPNLMYLEMLVNDLDRGAIELSGKISDEINLGMLKRMNNVTWIPGVQYSKVKHEILRKIIHNFSEDGAAENIKVEATLELQNSYADNNNFAVKLQTLQAIGRLATEDGLKFLQQEILRLNILQRTDAVDYNSERLLRQLIYSLRISKDDSPETISALREIAVTPYSIQVQQVAKDLINDLS